MPETQGLHNTAIAFHIVIPQVIQETPPLSHHLQEPPAGMEILFVDLEVLCELVYAFRKKGYLDFRGTRICRVQLELGDYLPFLFRI